MRSEPPKFAKVPALHSRQTLWGRLTPDSRSCARAGPYELEVPERAAAGKK